MELYPLQKLWTEELKIKQEFQWRKEDSTWKKSQHEETFPFYSIKCSLLIFPLAIVLRLSLNSIAFGNDSNETRTFYAQRGSGGGKIFIL